MSSSNNPTKPLLTELKKLIPDVEFEPGDDFYWSPERNKITYKTKASSPDNWSWSILHETAHAVLGHREYVRDVDLVSLEVAAWDEAKKLASDLEIAIDEDHIQDCLDTYRDWLHKRATCPRCATVSLQVSTYEYLCHNCGATWRVSAARFCRPYRLSGKETKKSSRVSGTTFR